MTTTLIDDPVALEILWERCISMVDEAADTLVRAAFSTIPREPNDYGCVLCDADGLPASLIQHGCWLHALP